MSKILTLRYRPLALLALLFVEFLAGASSSVAQNTIDFSRSTNLKAVYDAGLRPWTARPDQTGFLLITDQQVSVVTPNSGKFSMNVEIGNFGLLAANELSSAEFISQPVSISEATAKAREICQALQINMEIGAGMGGFEEKAAQLARLGNQAPVPQYWNGRSEVNGVRYSVTLYPLFGLHETRGKVFVSLSFTDPGKPMKFLTEPVKPPPGYEHMSMEPPETNSSKPFPDPAYRFDKIKQRIGESKAAGGRASPPTMTPSSPLPTAPSKPSSVVQTESAKSFPGPWIIGAVLLLAVAGGILFKLRRK